MSDDKLSLLEAKLEQATEIIREEHGARALAPGMECTCEFCRLEDDEKSGELES